MDRTEELPRVLSLCSGYGGIEEGISQVLGGVSVLALVEVEAFAITNLVNKMETGRMVPVPIWSDLKTLPVEVFRGVVDILVGGYPCQPFSTAGNRGGEDDPRHLWPHIRNAIGVIRPEYCFFENVEGHISLGLREVLTDLASLGYRVENRHKEPTWGLFSAREVGAPHQRKRVFILAHRIGSEWRPQPKDAYESHGNDYGREEKAGGAGECGQDVADNDSNGQLRNESGPAPESHSNRKKNGVFSPDGTMGDPESNNERRMRVAPLYRAGKQIRGPGARWPSRPGEQQYEWEEPRTIETSGGPKPTKLRDYEAGFKSDLGGTLDGRRDRIDRLRLLGNGVVPAVAEKAFMTLYRRMWA